MLSMIFWADLAAELTGLLCNYAQVASFLKITPSGQIRGFLITNRTCKRMCGRVGCLPCLVHPTCLEDLYIKASFIARLLFESYFLV